MHIKDQVSVAAVGAQPRKFQSSARLELHLLAPVLLSSLFAEARCKPQNHFLSTNMFFDFEWYVLGTAKAKTYHLSPLHMKW